MLRRHLCLIRYRHQGTAQVQRLQVQDRFPCAVEPSSRGRYNFPAAVCWEASCGLHRSTGVPAVGVLLC